MVKGVKQGRGRRGGKGGKEDRIGEKGWGGEGGIECWPVFHHAPFAATKAWKCTQDKHLSACPVKHGDGEEEKGSGEKG